MFRCQIMQLGFRATRFEHNLLPFQEFAYADMFAPDEMRALKVLGPMYRDVIKKRSDEELKRFFEHAYIVWDDYSPPAKRNMDVDAEEQAWLINQREKYIRKALRWTMWDFTPNISPRTKRSAKKTS